VHGVHVPLVTPFTGTKAVDLLLVLVPYYLRPSGEGVVDHPFVRSPPHPAAPASLDAALTALKGLGTC
jgi:hypothetical protein